MSKLTKNQKSVADKVEAGKMYTLKEAAELVKEITTTKFDASLDVDVRLGVDPRKANQMVRGVVSLPNGTGKVTRVLALCTPDQEAAAKDAAPLAPLMWLSDIPASAKKRKSYIAPLESMKDLSDQENGKLALLTSGRPAFQQHAKRAEGSDTTPASHVQKVLRTE